MINKRCLVVPLVALLLVPVLAAQMPPHPPSAMHGTVWNGNYGNQPFHMLVVREAEKVTGWSWNICTTTNRPEAPPHQVIGTMNDSEFRIEDEGGCVFTGKVTGGNILIGQNFRASSVRDTVPSDFPPPLPATSADWKVFLARFTLAVQHRDRSTLEKLASPRFQLDFEYSPIPGDELHGVGPGFWTELSRALSNGAAPRPGKKSAFIVDTRVAYTCVKCGEQGNVDFSKGLDGQWRWNGLFYAD